MPSVHIEFMYLPNGGSRKHTCSMGFQGRTDELIKTIPILETVAGLALSTLSGSKTNLQFAAITIRSPLARVKVLLSSNTEFKFSIHTASTGPSSTNLLFAQLVIIV